MSFNSDDSYYELMFNSIDVTIGDLIRKEDEDVGFLMNVCDLVAARSKDKKTKVGCVIARDTNILAYGYNGTPHGASNVMRDKGGVTLPCVIHAELNALAKLAKSTQSGEGATAYCTLLPCIPCTVALFQAGIKKMYYETIYRDDSSIDYARSIGFKLIRVEREGDRIELIRS
jgi:dCMP deaminase